MKFLLGKKEKMTQIFDDTGRVWPVTVLSAGPLVVTQIKSKATDKYEAVQFAFGARRAKSLSKPVRGQQHLTAEAKIGYEYLRECRLPAEQIKEMSVGQQIDVSIFEVGEVVTVAGLSKGRGFQGVVKRHGFHGGPRTHGQKHSEREAGSISGSGGRAGGRVAKGIRMAGRMGADRVTVKGLKVVAVDKENNKLLISGAVPGRVGTLIEIYA